MTTAACIKNLAGHALAAAVVVGGVWVAAGAPDDWAALTRPGFIFPTLAALGASLGATAARRPADVLRDHRESRRLGARLSGPRASVWLLVLATLPAVAEAQPALTLKAGQPIYHAPLGFAPCELGSSAGPSSSPWALTYPARVPCAAVRRLDRGALVEAGPGDGACTLGRVGELVANPDAVFRVVLPGGVINRAAPGVCDRLREWNGVGCVREHSPPRQTCSEKNSTVWYWTGWSGECPGRWILGGSRCGQASIEAAFLASFGRPPAPGESEERLAALATCGISLPACQGGPGCPAGPKPTAPPSPDPCAAPPPPPPPPPPDPPVEPNEPLPPGCCATLPPAVARLEGDLAAEVAARAAAIEALRAGVELLGERLERVEDALEDRPAPPPPAPPPGPPAPPAAPYSLHLPGIVHQPAAGRLAAVERLIVPSGTYQRARLEYWVDVGDVARGQRHQLHWWAVDGRYQSGVLGFLFLDGRAGRFLFRNGARGDTATTLTRIGLTAEVRASYRVVQLVDGAAGETSIALYDVAGVEVGRAASRTAVEPLAVTRFIEIDLGYDTDRWPNPDESPSWGWTYRDLRVELWP